MGSTTIALSNCGNTGLTRSNGMIPVKAHTGPGINNKVQMLDSNSNIGDAATYSIGEFYRDAVIFITGGTGFVGKALIEKLLRTCDLVDTIYILVRSKRGMNIELRLKELLKNPVFNKIREKNPDLFDKIKVIEGDVSSPNLGLTEMDKGKLIDTVDIVFHSAASVRFNEPLKDAVLLNTLGTQRVVELCLQMKKLKSFVHVSTAFSNADKKDIEEMVYKPPYDPKSIINCVENLPQEALDVLESKLLGQHPNTYTLTKSMAEHIILEHSGILPTAIVRPSIVTGAWKEPFPGWVDNMSGITGIMMEIGRGTIKSIIAEEQLTMDMIPVDVVASTLVAVAWHTVACRDNAMRVYNCTSGQINGISWKRYGELTTIAALQYPSKYISWYPGFSYRTNRPMHWIYAALFHTAPACLFDLLLYCTKHKPMMYAISRKFARAAKAGEFCSLNQWNFHTETMLSLVGAVKAAKDGHEYTIDMGTESGFCWETYNKNYMLGIRQYVLKDDMSSLPQARAKLNGFYWANRGIQLLTMYIILRLVIF